MGRSTGAVDTDVEESLPVSIGRYIGGKGTPEFETFNGAIDDLHPFKGALTPHRILKVMNENVAPDPNEIVPVSYPQN